MVRDEDDLRRKVRSMATVVKQHNYQDGWMNGWISFPLEKIASDVEN